MSSRRANDVIVKKNNLSDGAGVVIKLSSHYPEDLHKDYEPWLLHENLSIHQSTGPQGLTNEASEVLSCQIDFLPKVKNILEIQVSYRPNSSQKLLLTESLSQQKVAQKWKVAQN